MAKIYDSKTLVVLAPTGIDEWELSKRWRRGEKFLGVAGIKGMWDCRKAARQGIEWVLFAELSQRPNGTWHRVLLHSLQVKRWDADTLLEELLG